MMSDMLDWAKKELAIAGYGGDEDGPNKWLADGVIRLLEVFCEEGHSGSSAPYAVKVFERLANWKPLSPLTGEDSEWMEVGTNLWQNRRASNVFKDETGAYWSDGIVFWEWFTSKETGKRFKSHFTCRDSMVPITSFPWSLPDSPEYRERQS